MKLRVVGDDGYVYLDQLFRGDITVKASPSAQAAVGEIVNLLHGCWSPQHANWVVLSDRSLALFERLYDLSTRATDL